jgi:predicted alpha/beta superfamily hydrolase
MKISIICLFLLCFYQSVSAENILSYGETKTIDSKVFSAQREYYVHLPESYKNEQDRKYPILYVLHGQWDLLSTVAVVDAISNAIPELLIIGVNSKGPELRPPVNADDSVNIKGQQFRSFFVNELLPHINKNYRVAEFSILSGHSNSGRFVLNSFLDDPGLFNAYFAFSPSLDDGVFNKRVMKNVLSFTDNHSMLFMTLANEGEHMQVPYQELVSLFDNPQPTSTKFIHREFPERSHASTTIVSMLFSLETLFDGWQPPGAVQREGLTGLQTHYSGLTEKYGFNVQIPMHFILRITYFYSASDEEEENRKAEALVKFALERDPASIDDFVELVEALNNQGQEKGARRLTAFVCDTLSQHKFCAQAKK